MYRKTITYTLHLPFPITTSRPLTLLASICTENSKGNKTVPEKEDKTLTEERRKQNTKASNTI
jgi:hypothetical protein